MARHIAWKFVIDGREKFHYTEDVAYRAIRAQSCWLSDGAEIAVFQRPDRDGEWQPHETLIKRGNQLKTI